MEMKIPSGAGTTHQNCIKEDLGLTVDMETGAVYLSERNIQDLLTLIDITATQGHISQKYIKRLVGKLRFTYLAVLGEVEHLYQIQHDLKKEGKTDPGYR